MGNSAADRAYDAIHEMISSGTISAGQQIIESAIAESLGISRTPVREAIRRLQADGLVEVIRNKGCFLRQSSFLEMADGYEIISLLSAMACRRLAIHYDTLAPEQIQALHADIQAMESYVAQRRTREWVERDIKFHQTIVEIANVPQLHTLYSHMSLYVNQVLWMITPLFVDCARSTRDHKELLTQISKKDAETAFQLARTHHMRTANIIRKMNAVYDSEPALP